MRGRIRRVYRRCFGAGGRLPYRDLLFLPLEFGVRLGEWEDWRKTYRIPRCGRVSWVYSWEPWRGNESDLRVSARKMHKRKEGKGFVIFENSNVRVESSSQVSLTW
jgi:hypothetical protein